MTDQKLRLKRFHTWMQQLQNIQPRIFITENNPLDNEELPPSGTYTITGRILPNSDLYNNGSIRIDVILGPECPFKPPAVRLQTKIYHPNVDKDGMISFDLLSRDGAWSPVCTLVKVVEEVTKIIDEPCTTMILFPEAASMFSSDNAKYQQVALETYQKNPLPRN